MAGPIKVLVVDDSIFFRTLVVKGITADPLISIVGEAADPYEARDKIVELEPDVMTLDLQMPHMNGIEFLKLLLPQWSIPTIVISASRALGSDSIRAGASDFITKPTERSGDKISGFIAELIVKIKYVAANSKRQAKPVFALSETQKQAPVSNSYRFNGVIAIGASTGGTQATTKVINVLPYDTPGIVVVQHMPPNFTKLYAESLDKTCSMIVKEAADGDQILPGHVLIAPGDNQMEVIRKGSGYFVKCSFGPKVSGHRPSVDVLFTSVAKNVGKNAVGIIMTGMGADGANGLLLMRRAGAFTIGQDEKSSVVYGMPREAYVLGAVCKQISLEYIANTLMNYVKDLRA